MLFFALLVVVVFSLAFDPTAAVSRQISGGILWVGAALRHRYRAQPVLDARAEPSGPRSPAHGPRSGLGALPRQSPRQHALRPRRRSRSGPVFIVFYNLHVLGNAWLLALILPLGTWALVVNGTFFAVLGLRTRNRELLLPLLLLPISLPALLEMVQATTGVLTAELDPLQISTWITQFAGYDIIFTIVCILLFDTVLNAE